MSLNYHSKAFHSTSKTTISNQQSAPTRWKIAEQQSWRSLPTPSPQVKRQTHPNPANIWKAESQGKRQAIVSTLFATSRCQGSGTPTITRMAKTKPACPDLSLSLGQSIGLLASSPAHCTRPYHQAAMTQLQHGDQGGSYCLISFPALVLLLSQTKQASAYTGTCTPSYVGACWVIHRAAHAHSCRDAVWHCGYFSNSEQSQLTVSGESRRGLLCHFIQHGKGKNTIRPATNVLTSGCQLKVSITYAPVLSRVH